MEEFSEYVGLSRPTVSKYFNDPASVRQTTKKKIEAAIAQSGYRPNILAVNLNRRQTKILGVILPNATDPFYMALNAKIEDVAASKGFLAFLLSSNGKEELEEEAIQTFASMNVAGTIIAPVGVKSQSSHLRNRRNDMPLVIIDSQLDEPTAFVGTNNLQSMSLIVEYLCRSGEAPLYFDMPTVNNNAIERRQAYIDTMSHLGLEAHIITPTSTNTWDFEKYAFEKMQTLLVKDELPSTTLLCANDRLAFGVLSAAYAAGLSVGQGAKYDMRVAGHDNQPLSAYTCPGLTTVSQDYNKIARLATELLLYKLGEMDQPTDTDSDHILLNAELVLRGSA